MTHDGIAEADLTKVSGAGFLPYWPRDPLSVRLIEILRDGEPTGSQVAYVPVEGVGWDFRLVSPLSVASPDAESYWVESGRGVSNHYQDLVYRASTDPEFGEVTSFDDWDVLIWSFIELTKLLMDPFVEAHNRVPSSLSELLDGHYVVNEDFLDGARELVQAGHFAPFEFGAIPELDMVYFDYEKREAANRPIAVKYVIGAAGYDVTDPLRAIPYRLEMVSEDASRVVLLSIDMILADPDTWLPPEDRAPLSAFYHPD